MNVELRHHELGQQHLAPATWEPYLFGLNAVVDRPPHEVAVHILILSEFMCPGIWRA